MPTKSQSFREKRAKREGTSVAKKAVELGLEPPLSGHAAKKSTHLAGRMEPEERSGRAKAPPGAGRSRDFVPMRSAAESKSHFRSEAGAGTIPGESRNKRRR